jgi:hypothetical protein
MDYIGLIDDAIIADIIPVVVYFKSNANMITATYTTAQAGYMPDSLRIQSRGRVEADGVDGSVYLGSAYTITWTHRTIRDKSDI